MKITDRNFSPTGISETNFRDKNFDELVVWYIPVMFEILKQIELLICNLENLQRVQVLTAPINGNSHQVFRSQQRSQGLQFPVEKFFSSEEVPVRVSYASSSEAIRYNDSISIVFL